MSTTAQPAIGVDVQIMSGVARLTMRNPGKRNALTWAMYQDLLEGMRRARAEDVAVVVLRGTFEDGFAAGTDIAQFTEFRSGHDGLAYERRVGEVLRALQGLPMPVIAMVQGAAVGGGLALAASCDIVVAEAGAVFGMPIIQTLGNCPSAAAVARLRARMGAATVDLILLSGVLLSAERLLGSLVAKVVESRQLESATEAVVERIRRAAPLSVRALKQTVRRLEAECLPDTDDLIGACYSSRDFQIGVSAFLEHRRPVWTAS